MELTELKEYLEMLRSQNSWFATIRVDTVLSLIADVERLQKAGVGGYVQGLKVARNLCRSRAEQWKSDYESGWRGPDETIGQRLLGERYLEVTAIMNELQSRIDVNAENTCEKHSTADLSTEERLRSALQEILDGAVSVGQTCKLQFVYWCAYKASAALKEEK